MFEMNSKTIRLYGSLCGLLAAASSGLSQVYKLEEHSFSNPDFRARFIESYVADSDINPKVTPEEKTLFDEIVPLISSSPAAAITRLRQDITLESSAAFDFILGNLLYQDGQTAASIPSYDAAIKKFPNYFRAYYNAGRAKVSDGDYAAALGYLLKSLSIGQGDGSLYGLIGYCYLNQDQPSTALDAYTMAIMLAPTSRDWKLGKLQCHIALDQSTEAIGMLYEFITEDPSNEDWWKLQANQFVTSGAVSKATANLMIVKDMGKADGPALTLLGDLLLNDGLIQPAMSSYLAAMDQTGTNPRRILEVANSLVQMDETAQAKTLLTGFESKLAAKMTGEQELQVINLKARLAMMADDKEAAAGYLAEVVKRDPMNGSALLTLCDLERSRGDVAKAEFYAESAAKLHNFAHRSLLILAQIRVSQADYKVAAQHLRRAQQIDAKDYVADYLMRIEEAALRM
jgi:tetratricopeptide (TPR) repeat protein